MTTTDFSTMLVVEQSPEAAFKAINYVKGWWSEEIEGTTDKLYAEFNYHYEDIHLCKMKIVEFIPSQKVVWLVQENFFNFTKDKTEWTGTKIIFEIFQKDSKTHIRFTHEGLVPEYECYDICQNAWSHYIQESLDSLIRTGVGHPNGKGQARTENEKRLTEEQQQIIRSKGQ